MSEKEFVVKDSGARREFETGSRRDIATGKGRYDLIPTYPLRRLAKHYENGAAKYGDRNWEKGQPLMQYINSGMRHLEQLRAGEPTEDHAAACVWNIFSFMHTLDAIERGKLPKELDDRPPPEAQFDDAKSIVIPSTTEMSVYDVILAWLKKHQGHGPFFEPADIHWALYEDTYMTLCNLINVHPASLRPIA